MSKITSNVPSRYYLHTFTFTELQGHISTLVADFKDFRKQEAEGGVLGNSIPWVHTKDLLLSPSQNAAAGCVRTPIIL